MTADNPFARHLATFAGDLRRVRAVMRANLGSDIELIAEMKNDYLTGGKSVRAVVAVLCGRLCGLRAADGDTLAAAIEFIHTATLLHDDVVDDAPVRRHLPSAARVYGNGAAVLAGDFLYSRASQMLAGLGSVALLRRVADATNKLAEGEILQLLQRGRLETDEAVYYAIIRRKTANLFSAAAAAAALLTGGDDAALSAYGRHLGAAFQLVDDCLDYAGDGDETGKKVGADFREGKLTLPVILALAAMPAAERARLTAAWRRAEAGVFGEVLRRIKAGGALEETRARAAKEAAQALAALRAYPPSAARAALQTLAETAPQRAA